VHGHGVAARLVAVALDLARTDIGPTGTCWLGVNQHNVRAQRFYTKQGFVVAGTKRFDVGGQMHDDFVMVRPLATP
jgi:ribosomal protein S18 acetylase RimI-like enzyme